MDKKKKYCCVNDFMQEYFPNIEKERFVRTNQKHYDFFGISELERYKKSLKKTMSKR